MGVKENHPQSPTPAGLWIECLGPSGSIYYRSLVTLYVDSDGVSQLIEKPEEDHPTNFCVTSVPKLVREVLVRIGPEFARGS